MKANLWTPASLFSDPADLGLTDGAHDPVTSVFLDNDHLTCRTFHCVTKLQQLLKHTNTIECSLANLGLPGKWPSKQCAYICVSLKRKDILTKMTLCVKGSEK